MLVRQDDEAERIQLEQLEAQAEDTTRIEAAEAQLAQKGEDLKKLEWAHQEGAATDWEVEHARLEVRIGELSLRLARFGDPAGDGDLWRGIYGRGTVALSGDLGGNRRGRGGQLWTTVDEIDKITSASGLWNAERRPSG